MDLYCPSGSLQPFLHTAITETTTTATPAATAARTAAMWTGTTTDTVTTATEQSARRRTEATMAAEDIAADKPQHILPEFHYEKRT